MATSIQKGMVMYAWTVYEIGTERILSDMQRIGCDTVVLNSSYHQGRFFQSQTEQFLQVPHAGVFFRPDPTRYGRVQPVVHRSLAKEELFPRMREACRKQNMHFHTWWVGVHNSAIGSQFPELCVQNVWRDRFTYSLCPAQPDVKEYIEALFEDTLIQVQPDRITVEATSFMMMKHGGHHEINLLHVGEAAQWLLSLCFCPACKRIATERGIDGDAVQELSKRLLQPMLSKDYGPLPEEGSQIAYLMLSYPELYAYQQSREQITTDLIASLHEIAGRYQVKIDYIPSSTPFSVNQSFLEGVSLRNLAPHVDRFVPLMYGDQTDSLRYGFENLQLHDPKQEIGVALSLHHQRTKTKGDLIEKVKAAVEEGENCLYYYNYSLVNERRLAWVQAANESV